MPQVPQLDPSQVANPPGLMGGEGLTPEHVLRAASNMHNRGQLIEGGEQKSLAFGGKGSVVRMPHRMKGPSQRGSR